MDAQRTIRRPISCVGIGLHSGNKVHLSLKPAPADFGIRLTAANIDAHIARAGTGLQAWAAASSDLVAPIARTAQTSKTHSRQAEATCW